MGRQIILIDIGSSLTLRGVLPSVAQFGAYSARLSATGGQPPYAYTTDDVLPTGMMLDPTTGILSGDSVTQAGSFPVTIRATDITGASVARDYVIVVVAEPLTASGDAGDGTIGDAYSYTYAATGGVPPYTWSISAGALPAGVSIDSATGEISGTLTSGGAEAWTVRVEDNDSGVFDLLDSAVIAFATLVLSGAYDDATLGTAYSSDLAISGGNGSYSNPHVTSGTLPSWATLSIVGSALRLTGTPTGSAATVSITVAVDSGDGQTATSAQSFAVSAALPVVSLLHFNGINGSTSFYDEVLSYWTQHGSASISTTKGTPFGAGSSGHFSANGDFIQAVSNPTLDFAASDFTVEAWVYIDGAQASDVAIIGKHLTDGGEALNISWLFFNHAGKLSFSAFTTTGTVFVTDAVSMPAGSWMHVAACRKGASLKIFRGGTNVASVSIGAQILQFSSGVKLTIGSVVKNAGAEPGLGWNGYIKETRILNGLALYDADFTPPTAPFL